MQLSETTYSEQTRPNFSHINVGYGEDVSIRELVQLIARVVGFGGIVEYDSSKPDGTPRKLMDSSRINALGWRPSITLKRGLELTYQDFLSRSRTWPDIKRLP
jgi:GDP-L-fucose synthase